MATFKVLIHVYWMQLSNCINGTGSFVEFWTSLSRFACFEIKEKPAKSHLGEPFCCWWLGKFPKLNYDSRHGWALLLRIMRHGLSSFLTGGVNWYMKASRNRNKFVIVYHNMQILMIYKALKKRDLLQMINLDYGTFTLWYMKPFSKIRKFWILNIMLKQVL